MLLGSLLEVSPHTPTALLNWTVRVKDIQPGSSGSNPRYLTDVGGTLFFSADDGISGVELWKSGGTEAGTVRRTLFQAPARWRGGRVRPDRPSEPGRNIGRPVATRRCSGVSLRVIPLHATKQDTAPSSRGPVSLHGRRCREDRESILVRARALFGVTREYFGCQRPTSLGTLISHSRA